MKVTEVSQMSANLTQRPVARLYEPGSQDASKADSSPAVDQPVVPRGVVVWCSQLKESGYSGRHEETEVYFRKPAD